MVPPLKNPLGIYEKALPEALTWRERLGTAKTLGFDFVEISIDESDERIARLYWTREQRDALRCDIAHTGMPIMSMCFSAHRRFPMGSHDPTIRLKSMEMMQCAIDFAADIGIRVIQLAGYDVYYEPGDVDTSRMFLANLILATEMAASRQVMLAMEIMDTEYLNSVTKFLWFDSIVNSPWLAVYPDVGNLSAWGNDVCDELKRGIHRMVGVHVKDTIPVREGFPGRFKGVPFGKGGTDFVAAFRALKEVHYAGPFMIEMWTGKDPSALSEVSAAKTFVMEKMNAAGYFS
jgi:L-ribulose-5-phosphate 3-epimerase